MGLILNVQLSVFCNYTIEPNAQNISSLMNEINGLGKLEFLPSIMPEQNIDLATGKIDSVSNLSFVTSDQSNQIICRNERIDCILNVSVNKEAEIENDVEFAKQIITLIMKKYSIQSNRLALNINCLGNQIEEMKFDGKIIPALKFYQNKDIKEWNLRNNTSYPITISKKQEYINIITELGIAINSLNKQKRTICHVDINTLPESKGYRFNCEDFERFIEETQKIVWNIKSDFDEWCI